MSRNQNNSLVDTLLKSLPKSAETSEVWGGVSTAFQFMDLAEEVITEMKEASDERLRDQIHSSFMSLLPSALLLSLSNEKLYKHHCKEIIQRVISKAPLNVGTKAEVVCACCAMSTKAPLNDDFSLVYWEAFLDIFPEFEETIRKDTIEDFDFRESWKGRKEEIYAQIQKKVVTGR